MIKTTVSQKYQVVIPKEIREFESYSEKMLGLGQEMWKNIDPLEYIRQERSSWDKKYAK